MTVTANSLKPPGPLVGVLLAAGRGARFDAQGQRNKLLALVNGQAVAVQSAANLREHVDHLVVVTKPGAEALRQALSDIDVLFAECIDAELGMGHSLAHGVHVAQQHFAARAVLVALADMPFIARATLGRLAQLAQPTTSLGASPSPSPGAADLLASDLARVIAAPRFEGQRGHPVLFGSQHFEALMASRGDTGASQLLRDPSVQWLDVDDAGVIRDIDRPSDLLGSA